MKKELGAKQEPEMPSGPPVSVPSERIETRIVFIRGFRGRM
jgi:hypothetical protein